MSGVLLLQLKSQFPTSCNPMTVSVTLAKIHSDLLVNIQRNMIEKGRVNHGRHYSVDWTTGLDYWTGLLDSRKLPLEEKGTRLYRDSTPPYRKDVVI